jgi:hypothetical protein
MIEIRCTNLHINREQLIERGESRARETILTTAG